MSRDLGTSLDLNETMTHVESRLQEMIPHHALVLFVRRANNLASKFVTGSNERSLSFLEVPVGQGMAGWVAETGERLAEGFSGYDGRGNAAGVLGDVHLSSPGAQADRNRSLSKRAFVCDRASANASA